jgi:SMI1 / KNR4 family (SUKH-1)
MTEQQLKQIEAELGVRLPAGYRAVSRAYPFRPVGDDWAHWMYDNPADVVAATRQPLGNRFYTRANWKETYLAIGQSAAGDLYLLDLAEPASPVYCLSHEDHSIAADWDSFDAFIADWSARQAELERLHGELAAQARRRQRRTRLTLAVALACFVGALGLWLANLFAG